MFYRLLNNRILVLSKHCCGRGRLTQGTEDEDILHWCLEKQRQKDARVVVRQGLVSVRLLREKQRCTVHVVFQRNRCWKNRCRPETECRRGQLYRTCVRQGGGDLRGSNHRQGVPCEACIHIAEQGVGRVLGRPPTLAVEGRRRDERVLATERVGNLHQQVPGSIAGRCDHAGPAGVGRDEDHVA